LRGPFSPSQPLWLISIILLPILSPPFSLIQ
jgi:hypothetical protein